MGPGQRVGPYSIRDRIGRGTTGEVFRAERADGRGGVVALKVVAGDAARAAVLAAATRVRVIAHSGILRVLDHGEEDGRAWVATPLAAAGSLRDRMRRGLLPAGEAARVVAGMLDALAALHAAGLCHGDVKPENVLFERADGAPLLADVAALPARDGRAPAVTADPLVPSWNDLDAPAPGSAPYAAPEKLRGDAPAAAHDVFAAGVVLFEALTGVRPCGPERPRDLVPSLPEAADDAYAALCARRERRPAASAARALVLAIEHDAARGAGEPPAPVRAVRLAPSFRAVALVVPGGRVRLALPAGPATFALRGVDACRAALLEPDAEPETLRVAGPAPPREWSRFLEQLPAGEVVAIDHDGDEDGAWLGLRCPPAAPVLGRVRLGRGVHRFDRLRVRRTGAASFVYEAHDGTADATRAAALRDAWKRGEDVDPALARAARPGGAADAPLFARAYRLARGEGGARRDPAWAALEADAGPPVLPGARLLARGGGVEPIVFAPPSLEGPAI